MSARAMTPLEPGDTTANCAAPGIAHWVTASLPPVAKIPRRYEADFYGASALIAAALGLDHVPPSIASWTHGPATWWMELKLPQQVAFHRSKYDRCLVVTHEQERFLRERGYWRAHAVGAPVLYAPEPPVGRRPGSLLVMPGHTLYDNDHQTPFDAYARFVASMRHRFDTIVVCLHANDVQKGRWGPAFEKVGIPWVQGADSFDRNSLRRVAVLMKLFEFVTTNALGSHIPYAAYFGAKVSLCGPRAQVQAADMASVKLYKENPELLKLTLAATERYLAAADSPFQVDPWEARQRLEFGRISLGLDARRSPQEVAHLLGWNLPGRVELGLRTITARIAGLSEAIARRSLHR